MHVFPALNNANATLYTRMYNACAMDVDMAPESRCCIGSDTFLSGPEPMIKVGE